MPASFDWLDIDGLLADQDEFAISLGLSSVYTIPLKAAVTSLLEDRVREKQRVDSVTIGIGLLHIPVKLRRVIDELKEIISSVNIELNCLDDLAKINPAITNKSAYRMDLEDIYALLILDWLDNAFIGYKEGDIDGAIIDFGMAMAHYILLFQLKGSQIVQFPEVMRKLAAREMTAKGGDGKRKASEENREHN